MSIEQMAIVLHHSKLNGAQKLLLLGIANHDGDGGAYPSHLRLATYCGVSDVRNLRRIIDKCVASGELAVEVHAGGGLKTHESQRSNLYTINVKCPANCDRTPQHRALCWGCDEPLPFARYRAEARDINGETRAGWHKRCADRIADEAERIATAPAGDNSPGGEIAPGGEYAPHPRANTPPEPLNNYLNPDISSSTDVTAREPLPVDECISSETGAHDFALHNGKPWRCYSCGIHIDELGGEA